MPKSQLRRLNGGKVREDLAVNGNRGRLRTSFLLENNNNTTWPLRRHMPLRIMCVGGYQGKPELVIQNLEHKI